MAENIFEQVRDIPPFCRVAKTGKVYLRYLDSPFNENPSARGIIYVGHVTEDGKMLTEEPFFHWCERNEEVEAYKAERERRWEENRRAWEEERKRRQEEERQLRIYNTEYHVSSGCSILVERVFDRIGINSVLHALYDDFTVASLKQMAVNYTYHGTRAFLDQTGMYGTCYPPEAFPYLRAGQAVSVLDQAGEKYEEFFEACRKENAENEWVAFQTVCRLEIYIPKRNPYQQSMFWMDGFNPLEAGTCLFQPMTVILDRQTGIPVTFVKNMDIRDRASGKVFANAEKEPGKKFLSVVNDLKNLPEEYKECGENKQKFAVILMPGEPGAQEAITKYHETLWKEGVITANRARCKKFEMTLDGISGWGFVGCRKEDREWIISETDERLAYGKRLLTEGERGGEQYEHLFESEVDKEGFTVKFHLIRGGKKRFAYEAGYFVLFTNDPAMTEEEAVTWYYYQGDNDIRMNRVMNYYEGADLFSAFDRNGMLLVYFLSSVVISEIERLLSAYMITEDITVSQTIDRLNSVSVRHYQGKYSQDEWAQKYLHEYRSLWKAAGITVKDLFDYARRVMDDPEYFSEEEDEDD